jgi:hypothetical protein
MFAAPVLRADVTIRYENDFKVASFLPSGAMPFGSSMPQLSLMRLKGNKAYANLGTFTSIVDVATQEITMIDADHKRFAKAPFQDYVDRMATMVLSSMPVLNAEAPKAMASMKTTVSTRKTGRTDVIQGVQAEETEMTFSSDMVRPNAVQQTGPTVRVVMQIWNARPEEALRNPAVRQLVGYSAYSKYLMNPTELLQKLFAQMPGFGQDFISGFQELSQNITLTLKLHIEAFMPMLAQLAKQAEAQGHPLPAGTDSNAPLMEMNHEVVEISTAAIEDSVFQIPADFEAGTFGDMMKSLIAAARPAAAK